MTHTTLTSRDPQPGLGAIVRDVDGREWENTGGEEGSWANWQQTDPTQPDPETWTKVAGNYGPVTLVQPSTIAATTSTLPVTELVLARLDDMERSVDVPDWYSTDSVRGEGWGSRGEECPLCGAYMFEGTEAATEDGWEMHMADRHGRILAQCAAMRSIVEGMRPFGPIDDINAPEILAALASIWSDHPDWREEWR